MYKNCAKMETVFSFCKFNMMDKEIREFVLVFPDRKFCFCYKREKMSQHGKFPNFLAKYCYKSGRGDGAFLC